MNEAEDYATSMRPSHNGFVPLVLIALSVIIVLTWELVTGSQARRNGQQLREQQSKLVEQSKQIQTGLEKLARDLINVASTDSDAKALVAKYQINVTNPAPAATASPTP